MIENKKVKKDIRYSYVFFLIKNIHNTILNNLRQNVILLKALNRVWKKRTNKTETIKIKKSRKFLVAFLAEFIETLFTHDKTFSAMPRLSYVLIAKLTMKSWCMHCQYYAVELCPISIFKKTWIIGAIEESIFVEKIVDFCTKPIT